MRTLVLLVLLGCGGGESELVPCEVSGLPEAQCEAECVDPPTEMSSSSCPVDNPDDPTVDTCGGTIELDDGRVGCCGLTAGIVRFYECLD